MGIHASRCVVQYIQAKLLIEISYLLRDDEKLREVLMCKPAETCGMRWQPWQEIPRDKAAPSCEGTVCGELVVLSLCTLPNLLLRACRLGWK